MSLAVLDVRQEVLGGQRQSLGGPREQVAHRASEASETPHISDVVRGGSLSGGNPLQQHAERALVCGYTSSEAAHLAETQESPHGGVVHGNGAGVSSNPPMRKTILLK